MDRLEPDLNATEARLAAWTPATVGLDRDRMLFASGRASARSDTRGRLVACSIVGLGLLTATLAGLYARERSRSQALEFALSESSRPRSSPDELPPSPMPPRPSSGSYIVLMQRALGSGLGDEVSIASQGPTEAANPNPSLRAGNRGYVPEL